MMFSYSSGAGLLWICENSDFDFAGVQAVCHVAKSQTPETFPSFRREHFTAREAAIGFAEWVNGLPTTLPSAVRFMPKCITSGALRCNVHRDTQQPATACQTLTTAVQQPCGAPIDRYGSATHLATMGRHAR